MDFDKVFPLGVIDFVYINQRKIENSFSQIRGSAIDQLKVQVQKGEKKAGKLGLEIGNILALIGLGKISAEGSGEKSHQETMEVLSHLDIYNKAKLTMTYYDNANKIGICKRSQGVKFTSP